MTRPLSTFLLPLVATAGLGAADFNGGLQLGPAFPTGDLKDFVDSATGARLVLFGRWDLGGDYLYYVKGSTRQGLYLGAGLGLANNEVKLDLDVTLAGAPIAASISSSSTSAQGGLFLGYQFNRTWSEELAYTTSRFNKTIAGEPINRSLNAFSLVAGYTF